MQSNKIRLSEKQSYRLRHMKGRTGLTPNLVCRMGLVLSFSEPRIPSPDEYDQEGKEFNRYTLLGEWELLFLALFRERLSNDGLNLDDEAREEQFRAHLNRGTELFCNRVRDLSDIQDLIRT